ncbi:ubiquitin carboxyl-terminal hydrolase 36 isoform X1 [Nasonia vitripennis]|uniref:Ubiquitin carboxyl-terminal hydrolase n=1 Tax=Nasonia vitripennis TaxID=7425 RepID=A0A7M7GH34_NASVI|nr:ubiquitin carboxyl-terminal hydrolase 36 isoform X1 [Nasonia vitripennis]XP_008218122.1 ubiquitin carboxyl-terminal hydrolase 36 isoform X1 [Nasonia vitripennis]XP_016842292.1 ubiquitin carboxyl-terminal hydrolase 36 isoform X1 [Nasonia vitripennis]
MPAVSVCDPLAVAIRHNLDTAGQSKSPDDLNIGLAGSAPRILRTELDYEEADNYRSNVQDRLKSKYMVLTLPKQEDNGKVKDTATSSKSSEKSKEPRLPEPAVTLYAPDKVNLGWDKTHNMPVGAGMYNVGNTCYLNSTLQALFHVPALVNWLLSDAHHESKCEQNVRHHYFSDGAGECLTCAVSKTLQFSHQKSGEAIKPFYVYNKLKLICRTMVPGQQEDAHEFLRYLLEGMEKAYLARHKALKLDSYSKETTPINQIFGGYIRTEVKCLQCKHVSTTFQHFQDLLLDIRKAGTLDEALAGYFSQEHLDNNDYKCEACKRRVPATKQFILERPPKVLCVQLKRFSVLGGKISRHIGFKQTVDMGPYVRRQPGEQPSKLIYRLASMVTHMGPSVNCGHYTAIAQVSSGKFYSFDDSSVRPISLNNVVSTNAYIMIFEMEPASATNGQAHGSQLVSSKNDVSALSKGNQPFSYTNGISSKTLDSNGSSNGSKSLTSSPSGSKNGENCSTSSSKLKDEQGAPTPPPPPPLPPLPPPSQARRNFIGPQLPPHMEKNRLQESSKSGKLVDYDGNSSDDEENNGSLKTNRDDRDVFKTVNNSSKSVKINSNGHSCSPKGSKSPLNHNGGFHHTLSNGNDEKAEPGSSGSSSGSSSRSSSPKNGSSNGKEQYSGPVDKSKERWTAYSKARIDSEQKVYTKASAAINNKGWQVSKDSSSPSSSTAANGWLVSDNLSDEPNSNSSRSNNHSVTPSAAEMRSFNGTNRSETISHLQKSTQWAYGNTSVPSWNGGKARIDREVDNERRQERKRPFDNDEDELDRGRTKKVKMHHKDYRNDTKYNQFQEHHNNNIKWRQLSNTRYRTGNCHSYNGRPRHGGGGGNYNRPPYHRHHHNKSRNNWRR